MAEMNSSSGLEATQGISIDQRQLLSVTYIKENMDGEKEQNFKVVQQPETNYLPLPSGILDLQVGFPIAEVEDLQEEQLSQTNPPVMEQDYVIDAMPVAFKPPNTSLVINIMRHGKRWASPRPYTSADERKISVDEKVARLRSDPWLKNWDIEPRQRKNGKWDYYYRHKTLKFMCRSLVEVHCYEMNGFLPKRPKKPKNDSSSEQQKQQKFHQKNVKAEKPIFSTPSKKRKFDRGSSRARTPAPKYYTAQSSSSTSNPELRNDTTAPMNDTTLTEEEPIAQRTVEEFLGESYDNLMNMIFPDQHSVVKDFDYEEEDVEEFLGDSFKPFLPPTSTTPKLNSSKEEKKMRSRDEIPVEEETKKLKATSSPNPLSGQGSATQSSGNLSSSRVSASASTNLISREDSATAIAKFLSDQELEALAETEITTDKICGGIPANKIISSSILEQYLAKPWADLLSHLDT